MPTPLSEPTAFGHVIDIDGRHFWYDTNLNTLHEVDVVLAAVLRGGESPALLEQRHGADGVARATAEIETARRDEANSSCASTDACSHVNGSAMVAS